MPEHTLTSLDAASNISSEKVTRIPDEHWELGFSLVAEHDRELRSKLFVVLVGSDRFLQEPDHSVYSNV